MVASIPIITDSALAPAQEALAQGSPMKRQGSPEEMTNVMLMLCSPGKQDTHSK